MSRPNDPARNLLFGLLALQNGLIDQGQLVAAFQAWTRDRARPLAQHFLDRGDLDADQRQAIEVMVSLHLRKHGDDPEKSLAAVPVGDSTRARLTSLADPELDASLGHVATSLDPGAEQTATYSVGSATSDGRRFRVLRPHARGGLGAVFVALDEELHREVALKQILDDHADDPGSRHRFLVEAEVTGGLEHPGIVPVYGLGAHDDGRPYYAMRFIRGDSLKDAIQAFHARSSPGVAGVESSRPRSEAETVARDVADSAPTAPAAPAGPAARSTPSRDLEFRKLLRRFTDVCNAIEYAHARGVLHRDIKPGNIIVGKYGETLVVDWGLAKATGRSDPASEERTLRPSSASGGAETLPGAAIGTPAYMSPEQARGDLAALGPRSDIYSLGATLYSLLTGRPPFAGDDLGAILRRVEKGEFSHPRQLDPAIDPALEAICLKAMARKPDDRYASARALADDIERWLADERVEAYPEPWTRTLNRWLARHRTGVTGAAAALLVGLAGLAGVAAVQTRARHDLDRKNGELTVANSRLTAANVALDQQRQRAEDRERQAIDAVKRFRDAVADNPELKDNPSLESLRKTLLREPLAFFRTLRERLQADRDTRPEALVRLAEAIHDYAHLTDEIGDSRDGLEAHEDSLAIWRELTRDDPDNAAHHRGLATIQHCRGNFLSVTGRHEAARQAYEAARAIRERLAREHPAVTPYQNNLALSHNNLGILLRDTGDAAGARQAYEAARAIRERLAREHPDVPAYASDLGGTLNNLAMLDLDAKRFPEARDRLRAAIAWQEKALATNPRNPTYRRFLTNHYTNLRIAARGLEDADLEAEAASGLAALEASDPAIQALDARLDAVRKGEAPEDNAERLALARRAYDTKRHALAARLWAEAIDADPRLAADRRTGHPYNAACAAALAAAGEGTDEPAPDAAAQARLRERALGWLRGELAAWTPYVEKGPPQARAFVVQTLEHWRQDSDLAGLRDATALDAFLDAERAAWRALWGDVDALLARARGEPPLPEPPADPFAR